MTQEEKDLLLKDLCARLPYGVQCEIGGLRYGPYTFTGSDVEDLFSGRLFKPFLRPMSSMTKEEKKELQKSFNIESSIIGEYGISSNDAWWYKKRKEPLGFDTISYNSFSGVIDWLNAHHLDYRGLIEKGLALEAPENMYSLKNF